MSVVRVVVDKMLTVRLSGRGLTLSLFETIARRCNHLVFVRRLAQGPGGSRMPPRATAMVNKLFRDFRDERGRTRDKLVTQRRSQGRLPKRVRKVANSGKSGNKDDYVLEEAAIHDARYVITGDDELKGNLEKDVACVQWLKDRRIRLLTQEEYLALG